MANLQRPSLAAGDAVRRSETRQWQCALALQPPIDPSATAADSDFFQVGSELGHRAPAAPLGHSGRRAARAVWHSKPALFHLALAFKPNCQLSIRGQEQQSNMSRGAAAKGRATDVEDIILKLCSESPNVSLQEAAPRSRPTACCPAQEDAGGQSKYHLTMRCSNPGNVLSGKLCNPAGHHTAGHPGLRARSGSA